jgi:hypothetical protein
MKNRKFSFSKVLSILLVILMCGILLAGCGQDKSSGETMNPATFTDEYGSTLGDDGFLRDGNGDVVGEYDFDTNNAKYYTETWNPTLESFDGRYQLEEEPTPTKTPSTPNNNNADDNALKEYIVVYIPGHTSNGHISTLEGTVNAVDDAGAWRQAEVQYGEYNSTNSNPDWIPAEIKSVRLAN